MKNKINIFVLSLLIFTACDSGMERIQTGTNTEESVYSDRIKTRQVLNNLYGCTKLTNGDGGFAAFSASGGVVYLDCATDNAFTPIDYSSAHTHNQSTISSSGVGLNGGHPWTFYYNAIRNASLFIQKVDKSPLSTDEKESSKLQARFLRALYYAELFRWYGELVILPEPISATNLDQKKSSIDKTVEYIVSEFDAIANLLPAEWDETNYGRVTKGAVLAYKARTLLYAASPLNNPSNDAGKWEKASQACWDVIDMKHYGLYYDAGNRALSYARLFNQRSSTEHIFSYLRAEAQNLYANLPSGSPWNNNSNWYVGTVPTQNLVDAYDMLNGQEPITGYDANGSPIINAASGYNEKEPYTNRDPRLEMTVLCHGNTWKVENKVIALNMISLDDRSKTSGYILRKFLDDRIDHRQGSTTNMNYPMFRYAEILLSYAEAQNELNHQDVAVTYINMVRERAGVGALPKTGWTKETLRTRLQKEYRVEFAFEDNRFFDARRWNKAQDWFSQRVYKMMVTGTLEKPLYQRNRLADRVFLPKCYRMPIPQKEVDNSENIEQNPGW